MGDVSQNTGLQPGARDALLGRRQMGLMQVFRAAARSGDARRGADQPALMPATDVTLRSRKQREGTSDTALRADLALDVASLMNTVQLGAVVDLTDAPYVGRSVINYGFEDLSNLTRLHHLTGQVARTIRDTLIEYEPRLLPASIEVILHDRQDAGNHRLGFDILAEIIASPADIPLEFMVEVDLGAGKIHMQKLKGSG